MKRESIMAKKIKKVEVEQSLSWANLAVWIEALSSCAIEGNEAAIALLDLRDTDPDAFLLWVYNAEMKSIKERKKENG
jgi:hypothetical protein